MVKTKRLLMIGATVLSIIGVGFAQPHFTFTSNTGYDMTVIVPLGSPTFNGAALSAGDEIGAFTPGGLCVGASVWTETDNIPITVWGDNDQTPAIKDGMAAGETIMYRVWRASVSAEGPATVTYLSGGPGYASDGLAILSSLTAVNNPPLGGYSADNIIPAAQIVQSTNGLGMISVTFRVKDAEQDLITLQDFEYSDNGTDWYVPANGDASGCLSAGWANNSGSKYVSSTNWTGTAYSFTFDTKHGDVAGVHSLSTANVTNFRIRFHAKDAISVSTAYCISDNQILDNVAPVALAAANFVTAPVAGSSITVHASFTESNPSTNTFYYNLNGSGYSTGTAGTINTATPANQAITVAINGGSYFSAIKCVETDKYGNSGTNESTTAMYVKPYTPLAPTVNGATPTTVNVTINPNASEAAGLSYVIYETTTSQYVQADGSLGPTAIWQTMATWGTITVTGLTSPVTTYGFKAGSRNSSDQTTASDMSPTASAPNTAPTNITLSNSSVDENAGLNATVGTLSATDAEGGAMTYALVSGTGSTDNGLFNINGTTLRVTASLDYEQAASRSVLIRVTDPGSLSYDKAFTITVNDKNDAPTNITLSNSNIPEAQAIGTAIGTLSSADPDAGETFTYALVTGAGSDDNDSFSIVGSQLRTAKVLSYTSKNPLSILVRTTDNGAQTPANLTYEKTFSISISSLAPTLVSPSNNATGVPLAAAMSWNTVSGAASYTLQISTATDFSSLAVNEAGITATSFTVASGLLNSTLYHWRVNAAITGGGTGSWSAIYHFTTIIAAPAAPVLSAPADAAINVPLNPTLSWNASATATSYTLQVSTASDFPTTVFNQSDITSLLQAVAGVTSNNSVYYWRVNATNAGGTGAWSTVFSFTTIVTASSVPLLSSPTSGSAGVAINPILAWDVVSGAASYTVQVSTASDFPTTVFDQSGLTGTSQQVTGLSNGATYYWRANSSNAGGTSDWSAVWNFTTIVVVPPAPVLSSPSNAATGIALNPVLTWNAASGAASYRLQVSTASDFSTTVFDQGGIIAVSQVVTGVTSNSAVYYWRADAANGGGSSVWSTTFSFTTIIALPSAVALVAPGDTVKADSTMFVWNKGAPSIVKYQLQIASDAGMTTIVSQDSTIADTTKLVKPFADGSTYYWRVRANNVAGWGTWSVIRSFIVRIPTAITYLTNHPKSFSMSSIGGTIRYSLPQQCFVSLKYYNLQGRLIGTYINRTQGAGYYALPMMISVRGIYVQVFEAGTFTKKEKIVVAR
jgi:hypothetical protein